MNQQFKFNRKKILGILAQHQNNIDKKAINPIFSSIRFFCKNNILNISSLDGERFLEHSLQQESIDFDIFLPGFNFYELLRKSNSIEVIIEEFEDNYFLKIGNAEFKLAKYAHKSYPTWMDNCDYAIEIDIADFVHALKMTKWAASNDETRPFLNGVCLDIKNGLINICATDGLRLALYKITTDEQVSISCIMNKKSINDLIKLLEDGFGKLILKIGANASVSFQSKLEGAKDESMRSEVMWKTLLVSGKFPQYEKIIPTHFAAILTIDVKEFIAQLERIMIISNFNQPIVTLDLSQEKIEISSESALASGHDIIDGKYIGENMKISFNARLLSETLYNINDTVNIKINTNHSPVLIQQENSQENSCFILAPIKKD